MDIRLDARSLDSTTVVVCILDLRQVPSSAQRNHSPIDRQTFLKIIKEEQLVVPAEQLEEDIHRSVVQYESNRENVPADNVNPAQHYDCNTQFMWQIFDIPWDQLPRHMIESCERGEREKLVINYIVHTVVNKMREIKTVIPSSAIKIVTKKIVDRFPETFRDMDDDGVVIGDGTHSGIKKCGKFFENKKKEMSQRAGCMNWDPPIDESVRLHMEHITEIDENLEEKMEKCFPEQRRFLNENSSYQAIKSKCPILLTETGATLHFNKLTSSDMSNLKQAVEEKFQKFHKLNGYGELTQNQSKLLAVLEIVTKYFKEDLKLIYRHSENLPDNQMMESHPQILKIGSQSNSEYIYYLFYDKCNVNEKGYKTFEAAFRLAFALYFNFNLKYPADISLIMEFVQRYFFKIHPDAGSKANKPSFSRVVNLINKLSRF
ncbi:hypothetical protein JTB14_021650 [Gonioctena quinquepunctata]|nr:hypothetical protein JTB14_021650 [Gonioctena quinquepunctata]